MAILFSCSSDTENFPGYKCISGKCTAVDKDPTYLTLQDCKSECGTTTTTPPKNGSVSISLSWTYSYSSGIAEIGLGYSSSDISNNAFFVSRSYSTPSTFTQSNLAPGLYYYKAVRTFTTNDGSGPVSRKIEKSGSFTINSVKTTSITVGLN